MNVAEKIQDASRAFAKHPEKAILALLDAWRATRAPELADALDRLTRVKPRRPLGGSSLKERAAKWNSVADDADPLDVPRLVAALASNQVKAATQRLEQLMAFPDDPRLTKPLVDFLITPPYFPSAELSAATLRAEALLVRLGDVRAVALLGEHPLVAEVASAATRSRVALDEPARSAFEALDARFSATKSGEALLEAIYANPDDDAPRVVYADWLLEQGNPVGELIHLQLTTPDSPRAHELIQRHQRAMVGALVMKVTTRRVFRRGFLSACAIDAQNSRSVLSACVAPEWQTVEELRVDNSFVPEDLVLRAPFRNVRRLIGPSVAMVRVLAAAKSRPQRLRELVLVQFGPEVNPEELTLARSISGVTVSVMRPWGS